VCEQPLTKLIPNASFLLFSSCTVAEGPDVVVEYSEGATGATLESEAGSLDVGVEELNTREVDVSEAASPESGAGDSGSVVSVASSGDFSAAGSVLAATKVVVIAAVTDSRGATVSEAGAA
jgi:hypothetical protein